MGKGFHREDAKGAKGEGTQMRQMWDADDADRARMGKGFHREDAKGAKGEGTQMRQMWVFLGRV